LIEGERRRGDRDRRGKDERKERTGKNKEMSGVEWRIKYSGIYY